MRQTEMFIGDYNPRVDSLAGLDSASKGSLKGGPGISLPCLLDSWEWRERYILFSINKY